MAYRPEMHKKVTKNRIIAPEVSRKNLSDEVTEGFNIFFKGKFVYRQSIYHTDHIEIFNQYKWGEISGHIF